MSAVNGSSGKGCFYWLCCWCCKKEEEPKPSASDPLLRERSQYQGSVNPVEQRRSTTPPPTPGKDFQPGTPEEAFGKQAYQGTVGEVSPMKQKDGSQIRRDQYA